MFREATRAKDGSPSRVALVAVGIPIHVLGQERGAEPAPLSVSGSVLWSIQPEGTYSGSPHNIDALGGTTVGGAVSLAIGVSRLPLSTWVSA